MEGQRTALNHTEAEAENTVQRGHYKDKGIAVFTSGGDAQGRQSEVLHPVFKSCVFTNGLFDINLKV